jgi:hypothetical protein
MFFSVPFVLACDQWIEIGFEKVMEQNPDWIKWRVQDGNKKIKKV